MRSRLSGPIVILAGLLLGLALQGQSRRLVTLQRIDVTRLPTVDVYLTVTDDAGTSVLGLTTRDLTVSVDGVQQAVASFTSALAGGEHLAVALLFDRSGSMTRSLDQARAAASEFVSRLSVDDRLAVISFDDRVRVDAPLTADRSAIESAIRGIVPGSNTVLYDAIQSALDMLDGAGTPRQAILVLSDGKDTRSRRPAADVTAAVKARGVPVYTIGLGTGVDAASLASLADGSGGRFLSAAGPEDLRQLYQSIAEQLVNQYRLSFASSFGADEAWHALTVAVGEGASAQASDPRPFMSARGPGVAPDVLQGHERAVLGRVRGRLAATGAGVGLVIGLLFVLTLRLARPDIPLVSVVAIVVVLLAGALGAVVAVLVPELTP